MTQTENLIITQQTHDLYLEYLGRYAAALAANEETFTFNISATCFLLANEKCPFSNPDCMNCDSASSTLETLHQEAKDRGILLNIHNGAEVGNLRNHRGITMQHSLRSNIAISNHRPTLRARVYDGNHNRDKQNFQIEVS